MLHTLKTAVLVVFAMIIAGLILAGLILSAQSVRIATLTPADTIDAETVQMLVMHPTEETEEYIRIAYPEIENMDTDNASAISVHNDAQKTYGVVHRDTTHIRTLPRTPLSGTESFAAMYRELHNADTWLWTAHPQIIVPTPLGARSITYQPHKPIWGAKTYVPKIENASIEIIAGNLSKYWKEFDQKDMIEGAVQQLLTVLGEDVSFTYDILPLLERPSSIHVRKENDRVDVLLIGSIENRKMLHQIFERMHASYAATLPTATIVRRVLDTRFTSLDARHDPTLITHETYTDNQWDIERTKGKNSQQELITATKGNLFIMTSHATLLESALHEHVKNNGRQADQGIVMLTATIDLETIDSLLQTSISSTIGTGSMIIESYWSNTTQSTSITLPKKANNLVDYLIKLP